MRLRRHPSRAKLRAWLTGADLDSAGIDDPELAWIDEHLSTCDRCASVLENLEEPETSGAISAALTTVLAPPDAFGDRLELAVSERISSRDVAGYIADVFGAGLETTRLLLVDESLEPEPVVDDADQD